MDSDEPLGWRFFDAVEDPVDLDDPELTAAGDGADASVTAVVVAHRGDSWLPRLRDALQASELLPDKVIAVDTTGPTAIDTAMLLAELPRTGRVVNAPPDSGFGAAVRLGLQRQGFAVPAAVEWLWLLHDDCAPAPDALRRLLQHAARRPEVAVWGVKLRDWPDGLGLQEAGVTISLGGRRETHVSPGELDQGQHDIENRLLAVSTAGMLVRRDAWERLGGLEPALPLFRDDVDFGWRANRAGYDVRLGYHAVVHHAKAAASDARRLTGHRPYALDRRNGYWVVLANVPGWLLPLVCARMLAGGLLRSAWFVVGKSPRGAAAELLALARAGFDPGWLAARRRRQLQSDNQGRRYAEIRPLLATSSEALRNLLGEAADTVTDRVRQVAGDQPEPPQEFAPVRPRRARRAVTRIDRDGARQGSGPDGAEADLGPAIDWRGFLRRRPLAWVLPVLVLVTLVAARRLFGDGVLQSPMLLPAPTGTGQLWSGWDRSPAGTVPAWWPGLLALPAAIAGGPGRLISWLLIGAIPAAALAAWVLLRRVLVNPAARAWGSAMYGLAVAGTGAVSQARIGSCLAGIGLPLLAAGVHAIVGRRRVARSGSWRASWFAGMVLGFLLAFTPGLGMLCAAGLLVAAALGAVRRWGRPAGQLAVAAVVGLALVLPWLRHVVAHPAVLGNEAGGPRTRTAAAGGPIDLVTGAVWDGYPWWLALPLPLLAMVALVAMPRRRLVLAGWGAVVTAMAGAVLSTRLGGGSGGFAVLSVAGLTMVVATGLARLLGPDRGRPAVPALAVAALIPLASAAWWLTTGLDGPVHRGPAVPLPAYMQLSPDGSRPAGIVVLRGRPGELRFAAVAGAGERWPMADSISISNAADPQVANRARALLDLMRPDSPDAAIRLAGSGVDYLLVAAPADPQLVSALDSAPGLRRSGADPAAAAWRVEAGAPGNFGGPGDPGDGQQSARQPGWRTYLMVSWAVALGCCLPSVRPRVTGANRGRQ